MHLYENNLVIYKTFIIKNNFFLSSKVIEHKKYKIRLYIEPYYFLSTKISYEKSTTFYFLLFN